MNTGLLLVIMLLFTTGVTATAAHPYNTTVCQLVQYPEALGGKVVRVRGRVVSELGVLFLRDRSCFGEVRLELPADSASALRHSRGYKLLRHYVDAPAAPINKGADCLVCARYDVTATVTGLFRCAQKLGPATAPGQSKTPPESHCAGPREPYVTMQSVTAIAAQDRNAVGGARARMDPER